MPKLQSNVFTRQLRVKQYDRFTGVVFRLLRANGRQSQDGQRLTSQVGADERFRYRGSEWMGSMKTVVLYSIIAHYRPRLTIYGATFAFFNKDTTKLNVTEVIRY